MTKNKGKGGERWKRGKNECKDEGTVSFKGDDQESAQVLRMLGNGRCECLCIDGVKRLCHIRGKLHNQVWISPGDYVLLGLRDYQDDKADVILKYTSDEARVLKACNQLPKTLPGGIEEDLDFLESDEECLSDLSLSDDDDDDIDDIL